MFRLSLISLVVASLAACGGDRPDPNDTDGDGVANASDNCSAVSNADQADGDTDGIGNACDNCAARSNADQRDTDTDGVGDVCDNCTATANTDQADSDTDGRGNVCDNCKNAANANQADDDGDKVGDVCDNCKDVSNANQADDNANGFGDVCEPGCAGAEVINIEDIIEGDLPVPLENKRYYKFEGTADEVIAVYTLAKPDTDPYDPTYLDLVVTLFDESGETRLARNDDPNPRTTNDSFLLTRLPSTGTYCIEIAECNAVLGEQSCGDVTAIENFDFRALIIPFADGDGTLVNEAEANNTDATATNIPFAKDAESGNYTALLVGGKFSSGSDVDTFKFRFPADLDVGDSRPVFSLDFYDGTPDGNGSTVADVKVELRELNSAVVLASSPISVDGGFGVPVQAGIDYVVTFKTTSSSLGSNPFFLVQASVGSGNPLEAEANNSVATAQVLTASVGSSGSYFVEGNLPAGDVEYFSLPLVAGHNRISAVCAGNTIGSGLTGLKIEVMKQDETAIANDSDIALEPAYIDTATIPAGTSGLLVKVSAAGQSATNVGDFYRCGFRSSQQ